MTKQLCPRKCGNEARIHPLYGVLPCVSCIAEDRKSRKSTDSPQFYVQTQADRVQNQRDKHEADMMPPYDHQGNPKEEYRRAHGDRAKELFKDFERITGKTTELAH